MILERSEGTSRCTIAARCRGKFPLLKSSIDYQLLITESSILLCKITPSYRMLWTASFCVQDTVTSKDFEVDRRIFFDYFFMSTDRSD